MGVRRADFLWGLVAPAATPQEVREKIAASVRKVLDDPAFQESQLDPYGYVKVGSTPAEFARFLAKDRAVQAERVKAAGVKLD